MSDALSSSYGPDEVFRRTSGPEKTQTIHDLNSKLLDIIRNLQNGVECDEQINLLIEDINRLSTDTRDIFLKYCIERIQNYNDVIILTNYENMICQVQIQDPTRVNTTEDLYYRNVYSEIHHNDIVEVFSEDDQYYYGIHNGTIVYTRKDNCTIVESTHPLTAHYFVMNHTIATKILLKIVSSNTDVIQHKCKLLLFEYLDWKGLNRGSFFLAHNHAGDEFHSLGGMCPGCEGITAFPTTNELLLTIFEPYTNRYKLTESYSHSIGNMHYHFERYSFENILWLNFINLLVSGKPLNDSYLRVIDHIPNIHEIDHIPKFSIIKLIQNFKCLVAKTRQEEIELNKDINRALMNYDHDMSLVDLFIPHIKFVLRMKYLFDIRKRIPSFHINEYTLNQWNTYCEMNINMLNVNPTMYLNYLFTTVLQDVITHGIHFFIITKLNALILPNIEQLLDAKKLNIDFLFINKMIITQINHIVSKKNLFRKQTAGSLISSVKSRKQQNKKIIKKSKKK